MAEFGADFLKGNLQIANVSPAIDALMKSVFSHLEAYYGQRAMLPNRACNGELYELNLAWLINARELARDNLMLAELMMGISDEQMRSALSQLSIQDIQHIAQSGWLCFSPRFMSHLIQNMTTRQHKGIETVDVLLGLSGSL